MQRSIHRRRFLATAAATGSVLCDVEPSRGSDCSGNMTLGFSLYGMRDIVTETAIGRLKQIGYDSVEFCLADGFDTQPDRLDRKRRRGLRESLLNEGMCLRALMENLPISRDGAKNRAAMEKLKKAAALAHDLSDGQPPLIETILGSGKWPDVRDLFAEQLRQWAALAEQEDVTIVFKAHRNHAVDTPEHALWLVRQVASDRIGLGYDYSHFAHRNIDMDQSITDMADHIRFVHVKDATDDGKRVRFALPGSTGDIDYARLLQRLAQSRYTGDVCVEVSSQLWRQDGYQPLVAAKKSYRAIARAFHDAGISRSS